MQHARRSIAAAAVLGALAVLGVPPPAAAEEEAPAVYFDWSDVKLTAAAVPEGWKLVTGGADTGSDQREALYEAVREAAKESGLDSTATDSLLQTIECPGGKVATVALVDVKGKPGGLPAALEARAKKAEFAYRTLGTPARLLLVAAPADLRDEVVAVQAKWAGGRLAAKAWSAHESRLFDRAESLAKAALALEPTAAPAHMTVGFLRVAEAEQAGPESWKPVVTSLRAAIDAKAAFPLSEREAAHVRGVLGLAMLQTKEGDAEARDVLAKAVEKAALLEPREALINRYNLACAHGRLKELDAAFEHLAAVLEQNSKSPLVRLDWRKDEDFANLRADPRWAALDTKHPASGGN
jgi:hypothetical protein